MLLQHDNYGCSSFVSAYGKAHLAGNGLSPWQEVQRRPWALTNEPTGRSCGIPPLRNSACKGPAIHYTLRLAAKPHRSAECAIIMLKEHE